MNKKGVIAIIAVIAAVIIAVIAIAVSSGRSAHIFTGELYFFNDAGTSLSAEVREFRYRDDNELPQRVIEALIKGPENSGKSRTIQNGTILLNVDNSDKHNIVVDFSSEYLTGDTTKDILTTYSVVKSLCSIDYVNSVKVVVENQDITNPDGEPIGYLTAADINLSTDTNTTETREIKLYFANKDYSLLVPQMRTIKVADQQPIEQYIINELIKGPSEKGVEATLSKDTVLVGVDTESDICFVNFKSGFLEKNSGNQAKEILTIYSIVDSLTELDYISRVQFLIDGKKVDMFGTLNINSMFGRNADMIGE
jgi:germination protein M